MHYLTMCPASITRPDQAALVRGRPAHVDDTVKGGTPDARRRRSATPRTDRATSRKAVFTDGPFAETKEHVGAASV
jgi:hypothetical protein